jgi:hypothetical protein
LRETSPSQETWKVMTHCDDAGSVYLTGDWSKISRCYKLQCGFLLAFCHHDDTANITVKVFGGSMCRTFYHPVEA